jgi:hypothetical protein
MTNLDIQVVIERTARCVVIAMGFPDLLLDLKHSRER